MLDMAKNNKTLTFLDVKIVLLILHSVMVSTYESDPRDGPYFEGDILNDPDERGFLPPGSKFWGKEIPYVLDPKFTKTDIYYIYSGMGAIEKASCVKFVEIKDADSTHVDHVYICRQAPGCFSYVGRKGGRQILNLAKRCNNEYLVQHELMHAMGFHHEHSRQDRDNYIKVLWDNIEPGMEPNFEKRQTQDFGVPYDFASIMQYKPNNKSKNGKNTLVPLGDQNSAEWKRKYKDMWKEEMSGSDIKQINLAFSCKKQFDYTFY